MTDALFDARRRAEIREHVTRWISEDEGASRADRKFMGMTIPASPDDVFWLLDQLNEAERRMHLILSTIYTTHDYLDADGGIDTAAKFRAIERLSRLDWDAEGMSRVV